MWLESLPVLDPSDPKPGYYVLVGSVQNIINPIFLISDNNIRRVAGRSTDSCWFYDSDTDSFSYKLVDDAAAFVGDIKTAVGLPDLQPLPYMSVDTMTKNTIDGRALMVE